MYRQTRQEKIRQALVNMEYDKHIANIPASAPASVKNTVRTYNIARREYHTDDGEYIIAWENAWDKLHEYLSTLNKKTN